MELEGIMLSEISQLEKESTYGFTYMWNIRNSERDHKGMGENLVEKKNREEDKPQVS